MKRILFLALAVVCFCSIIGCGATEETKMQPFCTECGNPLTAGDAFCRSCGLPTGSDPADPTDTVFMLDGDRTYIDNGIMLPLMVGTWISDDGRYVMTYDEAQTVTIALDGSRVLKTSGDYTHLEPGGPNYTELCLGNEQLQQEDGTVIGVIAALGYDPSAAEGCMVLALYDNKTLFSTEKILLHRSEAD